LFHRSRLFRKEVGGLVGWLVGCAVRRQVNDYSDSRKFYLFTFPFTSF
jgi:hypothetical protein